MPFRPLDAASPSVSVFLVAALVACSGSSEGSRTEVEPSGVASNAEPEPSASPPGEGVEATAASSAPGGGTTPPGASAPSTSGSGNVGSVPLPTAPSPAVGTSDTPVGGSAPTQGTGGVAGLPTSEAVAGGGVNSIPATGGAGDSNAGGSGGLVETGEPAVHFVGRFQDDGPSGMRSEWSGSGIVARFEGTSVSVTLNDGGSNQFTVLIDGELQPKLVPQGGEQSYPLASGLSPGPHVVELYRRTEASFGGTSFLGFDFGADGRLLPPPAPAERRIELIGDSISCGYGNEGESATCGFSADTENHYLTYGAIAARAVGAELTTIAWSGKGLVYNYDTDTNDPLPSLYDRTLPTEAGSAWNFANAPHVVVLNLGTNDFSTEGDPTPQLFHDRAVELLSRLRDVYPEAFVLWTVGPLLGGSDLDAARSAISSAVDTRKAAGDAAVEVWEMNISNDDPGCDYHPGLATHEAMADALVDQLSQWLGW